MAKIVTVGITNFQRDGAGGETGTGNTLPEPEEDEETAAARPLVFAGGGACDSICEFPAATGTEEEDPTADDRPDSRARLMTSSSLAGSSGFSRTGATGVRFMIASKMTPEVSPRNGTAPVAIS